MDAFRITAEDGTGLHYRLGGPADGQPIMLCHGLGAGGDQFAEDGAWFAQRDYRVLVPDLRGHGASGLPDRMVREAFAPARLRADLYAMLDHAGMDKVHWVGNSLGGILGLGVTAEQPKRLASLALFGTALAIRLPTAGWVFPALDRFPGRNATAWLTARTTTRNGAARAPIAALLRCYDARAVAHIADNIGQYDLTSTAMSWVGPGLVLVGGRDSAVNRVLPGQLAALRTQANWRIADLPEGGHCANLDATEAWRSQLLSFWQTVPR